MQKTATPIVQYLQKQSTSNTNSAKYFINCSGITDKDLTTEKWLEIESQLKPTNFDDKNRILLGILKQQNRRRVVVKIGESSTLAHEFQVSLKLNTAKIDGFIKFICFFQCNDDYKEVRCYTQVLQGTTFVKV